MVRLIRLPKPARVATTEAQLGLKCGPDRVFSREVTQMKRKYGAARSRETLAEQRMREAAKTSGDNSHNYGSISRKGSPTRGKKRSR